MSADHLCNHVSSSKQEERAWIAEAPSLRFSPPPCHAICGHIFVPRFIFLCKALGIRVFIKRCFCAQALFLHLALCTSSAIPLGAFEISSFARPLSHAFPYVKLIVQYQVTHVSASDAYWWHNHTAKVNDLLIGAKEPIYSQMACSNSGNDAHKDHLGLGGLSKLLIGQRCYWRACDELLFSARYRVWRATSRSDAVSVSWASFSLCMRFGGWLLCLLLYSCIWECPSILAAQHKSTTWPKPLQMKTRSMFTCCLSQSGYFPQCCHDEPGWTFTRYMEQLRERSAFPTDISTSYSTDTVGPTAEKYHAMYHLLHPHIVAIKKVTLLGAVLLWCSVLAFSSSNTSVLLSGCPTQWWTRETQTRDWSRRINCVELEAKKSSFKEDWSLESYFLLPHWR